MRPESLDRLQSTPRHKLAHTIKHLKAEHATEETRGLWDMFFSYFQSTWIKGQIPIEMWNTTCRATDVNHGHVSTNNTLENFNCQVNVSFLSPHPNMFCFIKGIKRPLIAKLVEIKDIKEQGGKRTSRD
jgi:hypothetical protein